MSKLLSARQAAARLGVSVNTLYAYVSRGLVRSEPSPGSTRARLYHAQDIDALLARKELRRDPARAAEGALHFGASVLSSSITLIEEGHLYYRGHDALLLAEAHSLEEVAALIWTGNMASGDWFGKADRLLSEQIASADEDNPRFISWPAYARFQALLPQSARADLGAYDFTPRSVATAGARILRLMIWAATLQPESDSLAGTLQEAWFPSSPAAIQLLNAALILCADHELNVSSFTARCVASAGATPYAVVGAGLDALQGVKHGGNTGRVEALFAECMASSDVQLTLAERLRRGDKLSGFGHPLYPEGDPRARMLLTLTEAILPQSAAVALTKQLIGRVWETMRLAPNIDLALVTLCNAMDLGRGSALTLFALGRTVGWIGHALEQYETDQMIRPRARYTGARPAPIAKP